MNASRVFYALIDMESGSERKAKGEGITKQNASRLAKNNATRRWHKGVARIAIPLYISNSYEFKVVRNSAI
ncbi:hypothetical protein AML35_18850 [Escherichia coli]|nr:hypothetical protein AML35_18850 [Escherichia coli]